MNNRPNLLYIYIDQQSAGMMSCAGNREYRREWCRTTKDSFGRHCARPEVSFMITGDEY